LCNSSTSRARKSPFVLLTDGLGTWRVWYGLVVVWKVSSPVTQFYVFSWELKVLSNFSIIVILKYA